jgi:antitoxin (DNA-binding transcriptional repressor) of toxin-antitoxin stability system
MVRFATVRDFRVNGSKVFRQLGRGEQIVVTRNGKPIGVLEGISEEDLEDFILSHHPAYRKRHRMARRQYKRRATRTLDEILGR